MMTFEEANALFKYDPDTGVITNRVHRCATARAGAEAGGVRPDGYRKMYTGGNYILSHRLAWLLSTGAWPAAEIDHINGVKDDNALSNLREVSSSENGKNARMRVDNTSGVSGVRWSSRDKVWLSAVNVDGRRLNLGSFKDFDEAVRVRKAAELIDNYTGRIT